MKKLLSKLARTTAKIHAPWTRKKITQDKIYKALKALRPGDLILTHVDGELTNIVLDYWSHAGTSNIGIVYEATTHGVSDSHIFYFLSRKDDFKILRPTFEFDQIGLVTFLQSNLGVAYDFEFESNDHQFYCFELCAVAYMQASNVVINPVKTPAGTQFLAKSFMNENFIEIPIQ